MGFALGWALDLLAEVDDEQGDGDEDYESDRDEDECSSEVWYHTFTRAKPFLTDFLISSLITLRHDPDWLEDMLPDFQVI